MAAEKRVDSKGRKLPDGFSQRPDGRYMARFTHNGQRYTLYDTELYRLKEKVNVKKYELKHDIFCKDSKATLNDWYDKYLEVYYKKKAKASTLTNKDRYYQCHVKETLGKMQLQKITNIHIMELYNSLSEQGLKYASIKFLHNYLKGMFDMAVESGLIVKNPTSGTMKHIKKGEKKEVIALTAREQDIFMNYLNIVPQWNVYEPIFTVLFNTGIRIGEATALTWDDIDFKNHTISVSKTNTYGKFLGDLEHGFHITEPKTENSKRTIPMIQEVEEALKRQKEINKSYKFDKKFVVDGYSDFVFITKNGKPRDRTNFNDICKKIVDSINFMLENAAKLENRSFEPIRKFTPHTTRHTFATRAFEAGMSPKTVQEILGHGTLQMTMDIYTHVTEEKKLDEIQLLCKKAEK